MQLSQRLGQSKLKDCEILNFCQCTREGVFVASQSVGHLRRLDMTATNVIRYVIKTPDEPHDARWPPSPMNICKTREAANALPTF